MSIYHPGRVRSTPPGNASSISFRVITAPRAAVEATRCPYPGALGATPPGGWPRLQMPGQDLCPLEGAVHHHPSPYPLPEQRLHRELRRAPGSQHQNPAPLEWTEDLPGQLHRNGKATEAAPSSRRVSLRTRPPTERAISKRRCSTGPTRGRSAASSPAILEGRPHLPPGSPPSPRNEGVEPRRHFRRGGGPPHLPGPGRGSAPTRRYGSGSFRASTSSAARNSRSSVPGTR